jgi:23S rRNA pseudouridine2605 synthase
MADDPTSIRLNKYLALQLGVSRREADILIESSVVTINGTPAIIGGRVNPGDSVEVAGKPLQKETVAYQYIAFNKPTGFVCSRKAQGDNDTIYALLPPQLHRLKPVGRLDKDSSGLLLLTNDGDFAYQMTHPKFRKTKIYRVRLNKDLAPLHQQMISDFGIQLEDGSSQLSLERLSDSHRKEWQVTMSEGRNRQIRRTFTALGYHVTRLHRTQFGNYSLGDMKRGEFKSVTIQ